jgi:hypothetical protein
MMDVGAVLDVPGLDNPYMRQFVEHWALPSGGAGVEVVEVADDPRLPTEAPGQTGRLPEGILSSAADRKRRRYWIADEYELQMAKNQQSAAAEGSQ